MGKATGEVGTQRDAVYEQIYQKITLGDWPMGTKLPTQTALAAEFGVSLPVLRDVLMRLRLDGIIDSRQGAGTQVINIPSRTVLDHLPAADIPDVLRCYEFRIGIEGEAAYIAAQHSGAAQLAAIEAAHQRMIHALDGPSDSLGHTEDIAFHMAIACATGNSYYIDAIARVLDAIGLGVRIASTLPHWTREERLRNAIREHDGLLQAIRSRDGNLARQMMRQHITESRARVFLGQRGNVMPATSP